jgi:hypothetical protein
MELRFYYDYSGKNISSYELVRPLSSGEYCVLTGKDVYNGMTFITFRLPNWENPQELVDHAKKYSTKKDKIVGVLQYCFEKTGNQLYKQAQEKL